MKKERLVPLPGIYVIDLQLFAEANPNATTDDGLRAENKVYYEKQLIRIAGPLLVHNQFAQKKPIPKNGGKSIEFRKYSKLPKMLTPLSEGVTPDGQSMSVEAFESTVHQYGGYVTLTDMLELTAIDPNVVEATRMIGEQAAVTLDTITREVINSGTSVQYGDDPTINARHLLVGGESEGNNYLTVDAIRLAVRTLKTQNAGKINGDYVAIIHPTVSYELTRDPLWEKVKTYDVKDLYNGEIGRLFGVRFVETTEAKIFHAEDLSAAARNLTVASVSGSTVTISETLTADDIAKIVGRSVLINDALYIVEEATANTLTLDEAPTGVSASDVIYPGEAGADGRDVYSTLVLGADAYGTTEIEGGGLEHIIKQKGSAGTADPLDQRSSVGWKATATAEILVEQYMVRIETTASLVDDAN